MEGGDVKKKNDLTVEILKDIRTELRGVKAEISATNARLDAGLEATNLRLDALRDETSARFDELGRRIVESELRTATAITDLAGTVRDLTGMLRAQNDLRPRVERCELDIADLRAQVGKAS